MFLFNFYFFQQRLKSPSASPIGKSHHSPGIGSIEIAPRSRWDVSLFYSFHYLVFVTIKDLLVKRGFRLSGRVANRILHKCAIVPDTKTKRKQFVGRIPQLQALESSKSGKICQNEYS